MKKEKILIITLIIIALTIVILLINSRHWDLKSCNEECIHRGYEEGNCLWSLEISEGDINIGSCLIPNSKRCGNKGQCNCYCEYEKSIGGDTDEHGCFLMAGYLWCESKQKCLRTWEEGCGDCETDFDCAVFGKDGDCNCGCYNKDMMPTSSGGKCFCAAPKICNCVNNKCEEVFK